MEQKAHIKKSGEKMGTDPKVRPFYLAKILYDQTDEDHFLTTAQLVQLLEEQTELKVHRAVIDQLKGVLNELIRIENGARIDSKLMEDIALITSIIDGLYEKTAE